MSQIYTNIQIYVSSFVFYQKQNVRAFIIVLDVTMKAVAFESQPEIKWFFVKKLVIFLQWLIELKRI